MKKILELIAKLKLKFKKNLIMYHTWYVVN